MWHLFSTQAKRVQCPGRYSKRGRKLVLSPTVRTVAASDLKFFLSPLTWRFTTIPQEIVTNSANIDIGLFSTHYQFLILAARPASRSCRCDQHFHSRNYLRKFFIQFIGVLRIREFLLRTSLSILILLRLRLAHQHLHPATSSKFLPHSQIPILPVHNCPNPAWYSKLQGPVSDRQKAPQQGNVPAPVHQHSPSSHLSSLHQRLNGCDHILRQFSRP